MAAAVTISWAVLIAATLVLAGYALRHYVLLLYRLRLRAPRDASELCGLYMPTVTVLVPMHNEERVAADVLQALVDADYDHRKLEILAIDDRSTDGTGAIVDDFAARYPIIKAVHRTQGTGGKPEALAMATAQASGEVLLLFDADYIPGRSALKLLVAPFADPEVGSVMGRVVPHNGGASVLAALLELERAAGYQVGQQARYNMRLSPQFGGTVGGVRASYLRAVGGWNVHSLTEDTDLTFRLLLAGWKVAYVNRVECYEEAPQTWDVRHRQIARWATGHTECLHRFWRDVLRSRVLRPIEKIDALMVLGCYWTAPTLVIAWTASLVLFLLDRGALTVGLSTALLFIGFQLFGNQATFAEIGAAAILDRNRTRSLLLPLGILNFFASTGAICVALAKYYFGSLGGPGGRRRWVKTARYRTDRVLAEQAGGAPGVAVRAPIALRLGRTKC